MTDFYELARSRGFIGPSAGQAFAKARKSALLDFAQEASISVSTRSHGTASPFGFMASTPLSGGPTPCAEWQCRVSRADRLIRFAALYADQVRIRNPFAGHSGKESVDSLRMRLAGDLAVMARFEPLIRAGIVTVNPAVIAMCASCASAFELQRERLTEVIDAAGNSLLERFMPRLEVSREGPGLIAIRGPSEFVEHGAQFLWVDPASFDARLTRARKEGFVRSLITPMLGDIFTHHVHSRHTSLNYLTDRPLDLGIIRALGGRPVAPIDRAITRGLAHSVPVVMDLPIETILKLRASEGESFAVYRNAVESVVRSADLSTPDAIEQAFQDKIAPEIAKLDLAVRNASSLAKRSLKTELSISAAAVSIGMLLGTVQPALGAVLSALGGLGAIKGVMEKAVGTATEPIVIRDNSFYFLWKLSRSRKVASISVRS